MLELKGENGHPMTWYRYHRFNDILDFMEFLQHKYPKYVELMHIGVSFEGRPLIVVKISAKHFERTAKPGQRPSLRRRKHPELIKKPGIFIEAGAHGRKWISPAAATWILDYLVKNIDRNDSLGESIKSIDWYFMPMLNPDGYEFSHEYDRMWHWYNWFQSDDDEPGPSERNDCRGADINRNWDASWGGVGASKSPCSEHFSGLFAFSEPESKALSRFLMENRRNLKVYLSLHAYGQMISYPLAPETPNLFINHDLNDELFDMAIVALETLRGTGSPTKYTIDTASDSISQRSGSSDAYAMYEVGIRYAYTLELRDTGAHGLILPSSEIEVAAKEAFHIIKGMVDYL